MRSIQYDLRIRNVFKDPLGAANARQSFIERAVISYFKRSPRFIWIQVKLKDKLFKDILDDKTPVGKVLYKRVADDDERYNRYC